MVSRCLAGLLNSPCAQNAQRRKPDLDVVGLEDSLGAGQADFENSSTGQRVIRIVSNGAARRGINPHHTWDLERMTYGPS